MNNSLPPPLPTERTLVIRLPSNLGILALALGFLLLTVGTFAAWTWHQSSQRQARLSEARSEWQAQAAPLLLRAETNYERAQNLLNDWQKNLRSAQAATRSSQIDLSALTTPPSEARQLAQSAEKKLQQISQLQTEIQSEYGLTEKQQLVSPTDQRQRAALTQQIENFQEELNATNGLVQQVTTHRQSLVQEERAQAKQESATRAANLAAAQARSVPPQRPLTTVQRVYVYEPWPSPFVTSRYYRHPWPTNYGCPPYNYRSTRSGVNLGFGIVIR